MTGIRASELTAVCKRAEELAKGRGERVTTGHLLAAIASGEGVASELLMDRRLDADVLLKAARVLTDDHPDAVSRAMQRARELAARSPAREAAAIHLLFALCQERVTAAYRTIEQCGSDVTKLRTVAMQAALGILGMRRVRAGEAPAPGSPRTDRPSGPSAARQLLLSPGAGSPVAPAPSALGERKRVDREPAPQSAEGAAAARRPSSVPAPISLPRPRRQRHTASLPAGSAGAQRRFELDPKRFPTLAALGRNLTLAAARGELDPVFGRDPEIERVLDVLAKRHGNCPCLVGPAGVGKTSVVRGLAQRIADRCGPAGLDDRVVIEIDASALLAGTALRGAVAERLAQVQAEAARSETRVLLFFDEVHALLGGDDEVSAELRTALARGDLSCIAATSPEEYRKMTAADAGLTRHLCPVEVAELGPEEAVLALERIAPAFERHHGVRFTPEAIAAAVTWSARYVPERALPDKAVGVLDLAGARARRRGDASVGREQLADVMSEATGVPAERLLETDGGRMLRLEALLAERVVGHAAALGRIAHVLRRNAGGFRSQRPIGSFLLLGPTGVGKTETAKAIAESLFHSPHAMCRLDLSEYAEPHAIARLLGAPPGYVGHEAGGQLTEAVRRRPYQVVLLDEIEKAHRDVLEAFLQVFDEGRLTDGRGRTVDFTNVVVVMTSNIGADAARPRARAGIGFGAREGRETKAYEELLCAAARAALPPELYNRIDEVLAFAPLSRPEVAEVARRLLRGLAAELERARGVRLDASEAVVEALLAGGGFDEDLGARPMRRAIGRLVEAPIAEMILRGELERGDVALVDVDRAGAVIIDGVRPRETQASA